MFKHTKANPKPIVFSRWSRNGYAIYASLRKTVVIARLAVDLCKTSLLKNQSVIQLLNLFNEGDFSSSDVDLNEVEENLQLLLIPVANSNSELCRTIDKKILYNPYFVIQGMGFFMFETLIINRMPENSGSQNLM